MGAITQAAAEEDIPTLAINAGCDLLVYRHEDKARKAYESCRRGLESGKLSAQRVVESAMRLRVLKKAFIPERLRKLDLSSVPETLVTEASMALVNRIKGTPSGNQHGGSWVTQ